jgi:hypothetical protein
MTIDPNAPIWTHEQSDVLSILHRKKEYYLLKGRIEAAHGVKASMVLCASVFLEHRIDIDVTDFGELE